MWRYIYIYIYIYIYGSACSMAVFLLLTIPEISIESLERS